MDRFNEYWDLLSDKNMYIGKELITYYKIINENDDYSSLSPSCKAFLLHNLQMNPYPACQLLKLLSSSKHAEKNKSVEELWESSMVRIVETTDIENTKQFYNIICNLEISSETAHLCFPIIASKIEQNILKFQNVYLSLLARKNFKMLQKYLKFEEKQNDSQLKFKNLLMNVVDFKQHWFPHISDHFNNFTDAKLSNYLNMFHVIFCLHLENFDTFSIDIDSINHNLLNTALEMYFFELKRNLKQLKLIRDCKTASIQHHFSDFSRQNSILNILINENVEFSLINYDNVRRTMLETGDNGREIVLLDQYIVLKLYSELICLDPFTDNYEKLIDGNLARIKTILRGIDDFPTYITLLENVFLLVFLRHEHFSLNKNVANTLSDTQSNRSQKKNLSGQRSNEKIQGFMCNQYVLEKVLNSLKLTMTQKKHSPSYANTEISFKSKFSDLFGYINDGLWRLSLFSTINGPYLKKIAFKWLNIGKIIMPHDCNSNSKHSSSDIDERDADLNTEDSLSRDKPLKYLTYPKRKGRRRKNKSNATMGMSCRITATATTTTTTTTGSETNNKKSQEYKKMTDSETEDSSIKHKSIIVKMLASPETLAALCMIRDDLDSVQKIIKNYNLENTSLAADLSFLDCFIQMKMKLREIIRNYGENITRGYEPVTLELAEIKNLTAIGFETSKILNIIEAFVLSNKIGQTQAVVSVLEKYQLNYPFLNLFTNDRIQIINVIDLMLSLPNNYDLNLNLFNMVSNFLDKLGPLALLDVKNVGYLGFLKNVIDSLYQYKTILHRQDITIEELLNTELYSMDTTVLSANLERLQLFNQFKDSSEVPDIESVIDLKSDVNYFQRITKIVDTIRKFLELRSDGSSDKYYDKLLTTNEILNLNLNQIIGDLIFKKEVPLDIVEHQAMAMNTNLIHVIASITCPPIKLQPASTTDSQFYPMNGVCLEFISKKNYLVGYLLKEIHKCPADTQYVHAILNNMIEIQSVQELSFYYNNNLIMSAINYDCFHPKLTDSKSLSNEEKLKILKNINDHHLKMNKLLIESIKDGIINDLPDDHVISYIEDISDINLKASKLVEAIRLIKNPCTVEKLIKNILLSNHEDELNALNRENLKRWLHEMTVYKQIMTTVDLLDWNEVREMSLSNPGVLLQNLLEHNLFDLCFDWIKIHPLKVTNNDFQDSFTIAILQANNSYNATLLKLIELMPEEKVVEFYEMILLGLKNLTLIGYIINYLSEHNNNHKKYQKYRISLKIFENLPIDEHKKLWHLMSRPLLIIEQYLMNSKFEILTTIVNGIRPLLLHDDCKMCHENREHILKLRSNSSPCSSNEYITMDLDYSHANEFLADECVDCLLRVYAAKALDFRIITENHGSNDTLYQSTDLTSLDSLCGAFIMPKETPVKQKWMRDDEVTHCMCCRRSVFTMLTRRHHCRRCGRVVCHSCSTQRLKIPELYSDIMVRVCDDCVRQTDNENNAPDNHNDQMRGNKQTVEDNEEWQLSGNNKHDNIVRDEFGYEYAPSVSLCLSICKLHSSNIECANFLLYHCGRLESLIRPIQTGYPNPEIDYALVARMLHCLALAAKVRGGPPECDIVKDHAEIILSIVQNDCVSLLPQEILNSTSLRMLRDSLVKNEKWSLALELSLKCGFSASGVMAAWGIACLRAGCYETAREKISHCMPKISTDAENSMILSYIETDSMLNLDNIKEINLIKRPQKSPPLLSEIINILETTSQPQPPEVLARASIIISSNTSLASKRVKRKEDIPMHEPALNILNTLANLKQIANGVHNDYIPEKKVLQRTDSKMSLTSLDILKENDCIMNTRYFEECMYYLTTYGNHSDVINFLIKHKQIVPTMKYFLLQHIESDIFINTLLLPYLKCGRLDEIITQMIELDETLLIWKDYIIQTCRYLEVHNLLNSLYDLQTLLKDPIRASMTCVRFYSMNCRTFTELYANSFHLDNAQKHLQTELELCNWEEITVDKSECQKSLLMKMDLKTLNSHINTILRQLEVAKFLANCEKNGRDTVVLLPKLFLELSKIPTLFGNIQHRMQLAVLTLISGQNIEEGFGLSYRIIQDFSLNTVKVYGMTAKYLAGSNRIQDIEKLLECVTSNNNDDSKLFCDEIICLAVESAVNTFGNGTNIKSSLDNLIKRMHDVGLKINCHIQCGQLKAAYLLAVQNNRMNDIRKILRHAEAENQVHIKRLCERKLNVIKKL